MPCGCVKEKYAMLFVGWKDGKLIKGAPKIPKGTIQKNFIEEASLPHWVLVEPLPAIKKVPEPTSEESVYEEVEELEVKEPDKGEDIDLMTVKTLKLFIAEHGSGDVDRKWLKADLVREARMLEEARRVEAEAIFKIPDEDETVMDSDVIELDSIEGEGHSGEPRDEVKLVVKERVCPEGTYWDKDKGMCMPNIPDADPIKVDEGSGDPEDLNAGDEVPLDVGDEVPPDAGHDGSTEI